MTHAFQTSIESSSSSSCHAVDGTSKIDWALHWAGQGLSVFPCKGKRPLIKGWTSAATADPAQVAAWWERWPEADIGCIPGASGHLVIDVDVKNGAQGAASFAALTATLGPLPPTLITITPSGGRHVWLAKPDGRRPNSAGAWEPGVDTRGDNGFVLMPGSGGYTLGEGCDEYTAPAPCPEAWAEAVEGVGNRGEGLEAAEGVEIDSAKAIREATEIAAGWEPAVEGRGGNDCAYRLAARLHDAGVSLDTALEIAWRHWDPRCEPSWGEELAEPFGNAYHYAQNEAGARQGSLSADPEFEALQAQAPGDTPDTEEIELADVSFGQLLSREPKPLVELVDGLVEKGLTTFLAGPGGSNKSRLALQIGLSLAAGRPVFGRNVLRCAFAYLSAEDGPDEVHRRAQAICHELRIAEDEIASRARFADVTQKNSAICVVSVGGKIEFTPFNGALRRYLKSIAGHKFVVLDSLYDFVAFEGKAKVDEGAVNTFGSLRRMRRDALRYSAPVASRHGPRRWLGMVGRMGQRPQGAPYDRRR